MTEPIILTCKVNGHFQNFKVINSLSTLGAYGTVYKVQHIISEDKIEAFSPSELAIKVFFKQELPFSGYQDFLEKLDREHFIYPMRSFSADAEMQIGKKKPDPVTIVAMEYFAGDNLYVYRKSLDTDRISDPKEQIGLSIKLFSLLSEMHRHKIVHRDIKPENILRQPIEEEGSFKLAFVDFDFAFDYDPDIPRTSQKGTFSFFSPEIILNYLIKGDSAKTDTEKEEGFVPLDCKTDVWSALSSLFNLFTKRFFFSESSLTNILMNIQWELMQKRKTNPELDYKTEFYKFFKSYIDKKIKKTEKRLSLKMMQFFLWAFIVDPQKRRTSQEILDYLTANLSYLLQESEEEGIA